MICSRMFAGVCQSILRSTRNPLLNHEDNRCTMSRSSAARSLWPLHQAEQIGAHRHQFAGAARRAVEPAEQFLPPRLGGKMQVAGVIVGRLRAPGLDRLRQSFAVRAVVAGQRLRKTQPAAGVEMRDSGRAPRAPSRCRKLRRGRTAAPRIVRPVRRCPVCASGEPPRRSSVRPRSEIVERRSVKKALAMSAFESAGYGGR